MWRRCGIAAPALALVLSPLAVSSQSLVPLVVGWETTFRIDWSLGEERGQRIVWGHVVNQGGLALKRIRLLVDALEGGRIVGQRVAWLGTDLGPGARVYFTVSVPAPASVYRVSVFDYEIRFGLANEPALDGTLALSGLEVP